jgi:Tol biopolymer transport system component
MGVNAGGQDIEVSSVDLKTGKRLAPPVKPIQSFMGSNIAGTWSTDGKFLAFKSTRGLSGQGRDAVIGVLELATNNVRDVVPQGLQYFNHLSWAPDGQSFAVAGTDLKGRQGVYRIDARTGASEAISTLSGELFVGQFPQWAPDGTRIYFRRRSPDGMMIVERDLRSGTEREMVPALMRGDPGFSVSPDGQWLALLKTDPATRASQCLLLPVAGGSPKEILRVDQPQRLRGNSVGWSPDSRGVIVNRLSGNNGSELLFVPVSGEAPVKLDIDAKNLSRPPIQVHPDGQRIAYTTGQVITEVWVLENFLSSLRSKQ